MQCGFPDQRAAGPEIRPVSSGRIRWVGEAPCHPAPSVERNGHVLLLPFLVPLPSEGVYRSKYAVKVRCSSGRKSWERQTRLQVSEVISDPFRHVRGEAAPSIRGRANGIG